MEKIYFDIKNNGYSLNFRGISTFHYTKPDAIKYLNNNNINNFIGINRTDDIDFIFRFIHSNNSFECFGFVLEKRDICNS